jgi:hypothetical protein
MGPPTSPDAEATTTTTSTEAGAPRTPGRGRTRPNGNGNTETTVATATTMPPATSITIDQRVVWNLPFGDISPNDHSGTQVCKAFIHGCDESERAAESTSVDGVASQYDASPRTDFLFESAVHVGRSRSSVDASPFP